MRVALRSNLVWIVVAVAAGEARGAVDFPSVVERATGIRPDAATGYEIATGRAPSSTLEAGDVALFGIAGLRVTGMRGSIRAGAFPLGASLARLSSPVGNESRAEIEVGYAPGERWRGALRAGLEAVDIAGAVPERVFVVGVRSRADAGRVSALADVEVTSYPTTRDVDVALAVVTRLARGLSAVGSTRFDRAGVASVGVAFASKLTSALALIAGYDDGTETVRGAAVVSWSCWRVSTGVFYHAVLGVSHGVTVAWSR